MANTSCIDRIPLVHSVRYVAHGLPEVPNQYGPGVLAPSEITLTYRAAPDSQLGRVHAYVAGRIWVDGTELPLQPGGLYGQHYDDGLDDWPDWLAEEARLHDPEPAAAPAVVEPPADQTALRDRIAEAVEQLHETGGLYALDAGEAGRIADAVLAVLPSAADWDALVREADRLRREGTALHARAEELDKQLAALRQQVTEPVDRAAVLREAADAIEAQQHRRDDEANERLGRLDDRTFAQHIAVHRSGQLLRRMADETATGPAQSANAEETTDDAARRLLAVELLCSGRPGYHTLTVKQVLTAISEADDEPAAGARQDGAQP